MLIPINFGVCRLFFFSTRILTTTPYYTMKISIVIAILCLIGYARSATRLSVYTSSDCSDASRIGFINVPASVPGLYSENDYRSIGCTPSSGGQYYDIQKGLDEFVLEFSLDWAYVLQGSFSAVGSDCVNMDETNALTYAVKPDVCMNFGPLAVSEADNSTTSFMVTSCIDGVAQIFIGSGYGCSVYLSIMKDGTCGSDIDDEFYVSFFCPQAPAAPGAISAPTAKPIRAPISVPAAMTTPSKASSASLASFSIVGAAVAVFGYFL